MQNYRIIKQNFPIEQIENEVHVLQQLAMAEVMQLHFKEASEILLKAESLTVYPHRAKQMWALRREWAECMIIYGQS